MEHGKKYCSSSPTLKEDKLHAAILKAVNEYYDCREDIVQILKANIGKAFEREGQEQIIAIENRLKEIDKARKDFISLIASGACDDDKPDGEFAKLYDEEQQLTNQLTVLKAKCQTSAETQEKINRITNMIENEKFEMETFDNVIIRKLIECIKVMSKTELLIIFKGGYEVRAEIEK